MTPSGAGDFPSVLEAQARSSGLGIALLYRTQQRQDKGMTVYKI